MNTLPVSAGLVQAAIVSGLAQLPYVGPKRSAAAH